MMPRLLRLDDVRQTAVDVAPAGYRLAWAGQLDLSRLARWSLLATAVFVPLFVLATSRLNGPIMVGDDELRLRVSPIELGLSLVSAVVVVPVVHELLHGLVAALVGGRPVYGIVPPIAAFCHFERLVTRGQYAAIISAPLVVVSLVGLALMPVTPDPLKWPLLVALIVNAAGAVGDLWMLAQLRGVPADALIADTATGFEVYRPEGET
jgi:hypothetical protein